MGGVIGLDYTAIFRYLDELGVQDPLHRRFLTQALQLIEREYLKVQKEEMEREKNQAK